MVYKKAPISQILKAQTFSSDCYWICPYYCSLTQDNYSGHLYNTFSFIHILLSWCFFPSKKLTILNVHTSTSGDPHEAGHNVTWSWNLEVYLHDEWEWCMEHAAIPEMYVVLFVYHTNVYLVQYSIIQCIFFLLLLLFNR